MKWDKLRDMDARCIVSIVAFIDPFNSGVTGRCGHNLITRSLFYQTISVWSMDQVSTRNRSAVHNFAPTVTKFCFMWEGLALPHDTKFVNCWQESDYQLIIDPWIKLIWFDKNGARKQATIWTNTDAEICH